MADTELGQARAVKLNYCRQAETLESGWDEACIFSLRDPRSLGSPGRPVFSSRLRRPWVRIRDRYEFVVYAHLSQSANTRLDFGSN